MCRSCVSDTDCITKGVGPGVCMAHQDGRCATDAETIMSSPETGCVPISPGGGTRAAPYCGLTGALGGIDSAHRVIAIAGAVQGTEAALSGASVGLAKCHSFGVDGDDTRNFDRSSTSAPGLTIDGAAAYLRKLVVQGTGNMASWARDVATIRMESTIATQEVGCDQADPLLTSEMESSRAMGPALLVGQYRFRALRR